MAKSVEFGGETFAVAERIGHMALMRFAKAAQSGADTADMSGLSAMYDLLEQCIEPQDWARFEKVADRTRADGEELMQVVVAVMTGLTDRPTSQPSDSSAGLRRTDPSSTGDSSLRALDGRPDLQLMVAQAQKARAAS